MTTDISPPFLIRRAEERDCPAIVTLIRELAAYERLEDQVKATAEGVARNIFGPRPFAEVLIAEVGGVAIGLALYFTTFSTFRCQPGLYLEDLFVRPEHRGLGIGKALLASLARTALDRDFGRIEWSVLNWNEPAIGFYRALGASAMDDWTVYRIADGALESLARHASANEEAIGS